MQSQRQSQNPALAPRRGRLARLRALPSRRRERGQSLVEMAFIVPVVAVLLLGIYDLSRVFTSVMTIESAAREAADFGAWRSENWETDAIPATLAGMETRACIASRNLPDFAGSDTSCSNPSISVDLIDERGLSALDSDTPEALYDCEAAIRNQGTSGTDRGPCDVQVDLQYTFDLIMPLGFDFMGTHFGLPSDIKFTRRSVFAISDFTIDQ